MDGFDENESPKPIGETGDLWDSDAAIESLKLEREVKGDETNEALTKRLLSDAAPAAAQSIIHIALHSGNDNTRLNAAKYITDLELNPEISSGAKATWEELVSDVVERAEELANSPQRGSN